jgi:hypothetical protein
LRSHLTITYRDDGPAFGLAASLLVGHSPLRGCSVLAPAGQPKSQAAPSASIYEATSRFILIMAQRADFVQVMMTTFLKTRNPCKY